MVEWYTSHCNVQTGYIPVNKYKLSLGGNYNMAKLVECIPNFSEGRDQTIIDGLKEIGRASCRERVSSPV